MSYRSRMSLDLVLLVLIILGVIACVGFMAWLLGFTSGRRAGREQSDAHLRRNLNLPPRVQR